MTTQTQVFWTASFYHLLLCENNESYSITYVTRYIYLYKFCNYVIVSFLGGVFEQAGPPFLHME